MAVSFFGLTLNLKTNSRWPKWSPQRHHRYWTTPVGSLKQPGYMFRLFRNQLFSSRQVPRWKTLRIGRKEDKYGWRMKRKIEHSQSAITARQHGDCTVTEECKANPAIGWLTWLSWSHFNWSSYFYLFNISPHSLFFVFHPNGTSGYSCCFSSVATRLDSDVMVIKKCWLSWIVVLYSLYVVYLCALVSQKDEKKTDDEHY